MKYSKRYLVTALTLSLAFNVNAEKPSDIISATNLSQHIEQLSSDKFEGRAPATNGETVTINYIAEEFKKAGLQPAGDNGTWMQKVPLVRATVDGAVTAAFNLNGKNQPLKNGDDIVLQSLNPANKVDIKNAPLVFVGYGIHAPEREWNDYKNVDLKGKIAVMLINDADFETETAGAFDGRSVTYYGRWTYKYEEAARQGALGVLIVHETAPAAYGWATVRSSGLSPVFDIQRKNAAEHHTPVRGWVQRPIAEELFKAAGIDFETAKKQAQKADFQPIILNNATLSAQFNVKHEEVISNNVIGKLVGTQYPDESIIYSGHWDAFGIGEADKTGDSVRRGAVDNATAIAGILELARVYAKKPAERTQLFIALTAEEKGLLGAYYYAEHPIMPLEKTAAMLNIEMLSPDGATRDISSWGKGYVSLENDLKNTAMNNQRTYSPDPNLEAGFFFRADHFALARAGVPAITVGPGLDLIEGGKEKGKELRDIYFANCYHQPCDAWTPKWDTVGQANDIYLIYLMGKKLANSREWPQWEDNSEFKALRTKSDSARK